MDFVNLANGVGRTDAVAALEAFVSRQEGDSAGAAKILDNIAEKLSACLTYYSAEVPAEKISERKQRQDNAKSV
ncbi:MAG: hypothetical protein LBI61_00005, partial [Puniceicoccales bacterium]|nr:hypothetical protein [Puniceicoccales bacterium]